MTKVLRTMAMTALAAVSGFMLAAAPGCSGGGGTDKADTGTGGACAAADADTQEANCRCTAKTDCAAGNSAKWACTPAHACVRICTTAADCNSGSVCEDLICRPPACGDDSECNSGQQCIGGACKSAISAVTTCAVVPSSAVIPAAGKKVFSVIGYDAAGAAVAYKGTVTWGKTGISATTADTGLSASFASAATASASGTVTASIGSVACSVANVTEYGPASGGVRVVVVSESATSTAPESSPIAGATVVLDNDNAGAQTTGADGSYTFDGASNDPHTVSVFKAGYSYVTVVGTTATDLLISVKPTPNPGNFNGQLKDSDFANVDNRNGTLHLDITGSSIGGNLIDLSFANLLGPSQPITISLGTGTPYGPFDLPEGIAIGLGAQMFGENGGGHYGAVAAPGYRALWSLGGNAVIGDVLKAIGPVLNGGGGSITDSIPTILTALLPIIGSLDSGVTSGIKVAPGDAKTLSFGGAQPSLKLDTPQRLHLIAKTPNLPSYKNDAGAIANYDGAIVLGGVLAEEQGLVPLGLTAGLDLDTVPNDKVPNHKTDPVGTGGVEGQVPLRVAPRHGGVETSKWGFVTLGASIKDLVGGFGGADEPSQGIVLSGNVSLFQKGTTNPYVLKYNGGANTTVDLSDAFLGVPDLPTVSGRTVTLNTQVDGASYYQMAVGSDDQQWAIYYPAGTTSVEIPEVPATFDDRWTGTPAGGSAPATAPKISLKTISLGYPVNGEPVTYNGVWQFNGVESAKLASTIDKFSLREINR